MENKWISDIKYYIKWINIIQVELSGRGGGEYQIFAPPQRFSFPSLINQPGFILPDYNLNRQLTLKIFEK